METTPTADGVSKTNVQNVWDRIAAADPASPALLELVRIRLEEGRAELALETAERISSAHPYFLQPIVLKARALHALERFDEAREAMAEASAIVDELAESLSEMSGLLKELGVAGEAEKDYFYEEADEAEVVPTETLANLYLDQGHKDKAIEIYGLLLEQDPGNETLRTKLDELIRPVKDDMAIPEGWEDAALDAFDEEPAVGDAKAEAEAEAEDESEFLEPELLDLPPGMPHSLADATAGQVAAPASEAPIEEEDFEPVDDEVYEEDAGEEFAEEDDESESELPDFGDEEEGEEFVEEPEEDADDELPAFDDYEEGEAFPEPELLDLPPDMPHSLAEAVPPDAVRPEDAVFDDSLPGEDVLEPMEDEYEEDAADEFVDEEDADDELPAFDDYEDDEDDEFLEPELLDLPPGLPRSLADAGIPDDAESAEADADYDLSETDEKVEPESIPDLIPGQDSDMEVPGLESYEHEAALDKAQADAMSMEAKKRLAAGLRRLRDAARRRREALERTNPEID